MGGKQRTFLTSTITSDHSKIKFINSGNGSLLVSRMPTRQLQELDFKQCCFRRKGSPGWDDDETYFCPAADDQMCNFKEEKYQEMRLTLPQNESRSEEKKRKLEESQNAENLRARLHTMSRQKPPCKDFIAGKCRRLECHDSACPRDHGDELEQLRKGIECQSSSNRKAPTLCRFPPRICPYKNHRELKNDEGSSMS